MGGEKRQYVRWEKSVKVSYSLVEEDELFNEVFTEDISESGLRILIYEKLDIHENIKMKIEFAHDSVPIVIGGKVVYSEAHNEQYRIGVEFTNMNDFKKERLKRCLEMAS